MKYDHVFFDDAYTLVENNYVLSAEPDIATFMCLSNGYMGVRASLEEYSSLNVQGLYVRGLLDSCPCEPMPSNDNEYMKKWFFNEEAIKRFEESDTIVNLADFLTLRFTVNGETFYPWDGTVIKWKRTFDIRGNKLVREVVWENSKGEKTEFRFERFASYSNDHVFAIKVKITPLNYDGKIEILSGIDSVVKTNGATGGGHSITTNKNFLVSGNCVYYSCETGKKYGYKVCIGAKTNIYYNKEMTWQDANIDGLASIKTSVNVEKGNFIKVEKLIYITTERDTESFSQKYVEENLQSLSNYDELYNKHLEKWTDYFSKIDITIKGDDRADRALRFSNYHTLGSFNRNDSVHSLAAKGLTGPGYGGLVWWDCEVYQSPVFYMTMPNEAKNILLYRYRLLDMAKQNAIKDGYKGARYPFNSGTTGEECVWPTYRHPFMQIHVVADVAWSVCNYYSCTKDDEFMISYGMEMLLEICKYWMSRVLKEDKGYVINQVTGTDEHHAYINNNAYTNYLVRYIMQRTLNLVKKYGNDIKNVLIKTEFNSKEIDNLEDIMTNLYLPFDKTSGLIPQFDGYLGLSRELEIVGGNSGKIQKNTMKSAGGMYHKSQIIKQPDVLMLFAYQNMEFSDKVYRRNWDYYRARCESASTLSYSVHSICASDTDEPESAYTYFMDAAEVDLSDSHNAVSMGVHSACEAGAWLSVVRGISGIVFNDEYLKINPHMIPWWDEVSFAIKYQGQTLKVVLTNKEIKITSVSENNNKVCVSLCGEEQDLSPNQTIQKTISIA